MPKEQYVINDQVTAEVIIISGRQHHQYRKNYENKEYSVSILYII